MWQMIAKAVAGGIGGAMKSTADTQKTNLSGTQQTEQQSEEQSGSQLGGGIGNIAEKMMKSKGGN